MFVHANIATVPAFAPVHEYADWYWAFLETKPDMVLHPTCPLPEVVAWHREHARGHPFDDFIDRAHLRALRRRRVRAAPRRRGHALPGARHQAPRRLLLVGHRATRSARRCTLGPKRDVTAELADAVRRRGPRVRLLLLAPRLGPSRVSRPAALRRRVHASADPGARRAVRARAALGRRPLGSPRSALALRPDPRRRPRGGRRARRSTSCATTAGSRREPRLHRVRVRRARRRARRAGGSCAAGSATRSA